jgi:hypothetical protein
MKNVDLHVDEGIVLSVARLRGTMISTRSGPPVFDDQSSFVLRVATGRVAMDMRSLGNLINRHALAYKGAPLSDVSVRAEGGRLALKGKLHKGLTVPFSAKVSVGCTDDGRIQLHTESMKAIGIPTKGLLDLFGLELDDLVDLKERRGLDVRDNDIIIAPGQVLPSPEIQGRITRVAVERDRIVQTFESGEQPRALARPSPSARNYMYFGGGEIRFGKLTMHDTDLQLIDSDPKDAFDFYPKKYNQQLVAGYSKNTPALGLKTYMPDFNDLRGMAKR